MKNSMEPIVCDVLIVGGGGAAGRAAIAAHDAGASVFIASKSRLGGGATGFSMSEMAGYNSPDGAADTADNPEEYLKDIVEAGMGMADPEAARVLAENASSTVEQLERWGVPFERTSGGGYYAFLSCHSTKARTHVIKGHGEPIVQAQGRQIRQRGIRVAEGMLVTALAVKDGQVIGATAVDTGGKEYAIAAGAVVLATGGATQAIARNMNPPDVTGDGYAMAYRAGARMVNMEFMQAGLGFIHPAASLINAYIWGGHPVLTNDAGKRFMDALPGGMDWRHVMDEHCKHFPFSSRDDSKWLEVSIQKELAEGRGSVHGGISADFSMMTDEHVRNLSDAYGLHHMWPIARDYFLSKGIDVLRGGTEVACFAHAVNGGVQINGRAETSLAGLYAAGETAGGPHGADRLGGNMMVTCQVYGRIAGENAAAFAAASRLRETNDTAFHHVATSVRPILFADIDAGDLRRRLAAEGQKHLLVRRTEQGLRTLLDEIRTLESGIGTAPAGSQPRPENVSAANLLISAKMMAVAALRRRESRGSHFREDYMETDPRCAKPWVFDVTSMEQE